MTVLLPKFQRDKGRVTDEAVWRGRREVLAALSMGALAGVLPLSVQAASPRNLQFQASGSTVKRSDEGVVTSYNNFYEFGYDKADPARRAKNLRVEPWSVLIEGEVEKPGRYPLETLLSGLGLEERVYPMRCVEAWSMMVPWVGVPLAAVIRKLQPNSRAKFVSFETLHDPEQMPEQKSGLRLGGLDWPYREGLRMDEALHPLTLLAVGLYGKTLPPQNGAPLRLVVPWKYGFKGIKSIVKMRFQETRPATTWNLSAPEEYGFYANVNPAVAHPRWTQARERRIYSSSLLGVERIATSPFNGFEAEVAPLYRGLDLRRNF